MKITKMITINLVFNKLIQIIESDNLNEKKLFILQPKANLSKSRANLVTCPNEKILEAILCGLPWKLDKFF